MEEQKRKERIAKEKELRKKREQILAEKIRKEQIERERYLNSLQTKITIFGNQVLVPCRLSYGENEIEAVLLLDTGASTILLHEETAKKLYIKQTKSSKGQVAGGKMIEIKYAKLSYVKVGPYKRENLYAAIAKHNGPPVKFNGLLGMNFLKNLKIGKKLMLGFAVIILFMTVIGLNGFRSVFQIEEDLDGILEVNLKGINYLLQADRDYWSRPRMSELGMHSPRR